MEKILEIKNLTKHFGDIKAVNDISFELEKGEILGFIGPNGAGKSTTMRLIMNLINKDSGEIFFCGKLLTKDDLDLKKYIGYCPSEINLYSDYTVKQMFDFHIRFYSDCAKIEAR